MAMNRESISDVYERIEDLRTDYLRELTGLSKVVIALSAAVLGLLLSPFGIYLSSKAGPRLIFGAWSILAVAAALGFAQMLTFSRRFRSAAEYRWTSHIIDTIVRLNGDEGTLKEFLSKSDKHKLSHDRTYRVCFWLIVGEFVCLSIGFGLLACAMLRVVGR
jgi:hypothetical protein